MKPCKASSRKLRTENTYEQNKHKDRALSAINTTRERWERLMEGPKEMGKV